MVTHGTGEWFKGVHGGEGLVDAGNVLFLDQGVATQMWSVYKNLSSANLWFMYFSVSFFYFNKMFSTHYNPISRLQKKKKICHVKWGGGELKILKLIKWLGWICCRKGKLLTSHALAKCKLTRDVLLSFTCLDSSYNTVAQVFSFNSPGKT